MFFQRRSCYSVSRAQCLMSLTMPLTSSSRGQVISVKCDENLRHKVWDSKSDKKLPDRRYSTSESLGLGYIGYMYKTLWRSWVKKRGGINESHTNSLTLMAWRIYKRAGLYLASPERVWSKYKQDVQFRPMWETPSKQTYRLNAVICSTETELIVAKKFKTRLLNPNPVKQNW